NLIRDVLNYTKVARAPVELHTVELDSMIDGIINDSPTFQPANAQVEIERPLLPVLGNEAFLTQCLSNLLSNAVKFVRPGAKPQVRIWTTPAQANVQVCVADQGIGIRAEDQERIFGIFNRVNAPNKYEGTGMGLSIVKKAVERMGGEAGVKSAPGKGSCFWLQLHSGAR